MNKLNRLTLKNFKCFRDASVDIGGLTVFCGANGSGKSSLIQSLLLLHQTHTQKMFAPNGDWVNLGNANDVFSGNAKDENLSVTATFSDDKTFGVIAKFVPGESEFESIRLKSSIENPVNYPFLANTNFQYICADRWGPRLLHPYQPDYSYDVGKYGEKTATVLSNFGDRPIPNKEFNQPESMRESIRLDYLTECWLNEILPGTRLKISTFETADTAQIRFGNVDTATQHGYFRPTNIAFGLSYVLPVIVALLSATRGATVIIENPEAHLHPKAQFALGEIICRAVNAGVQIIIETHSEHIVTRIQRRIAEDLIDSDSVKMIFAFRSENGTELNKLEVNEYGSITNWPKDFFGDLTSEIEIRTRAMFQKMAQKKSGK